MGGGLSSDFANRRVDLGAPAADAIDNVVRGYSMPAPTSTTQQCAARSISAILDRARAEHARDQCDIDLVVMGALSRTGLRGLLIVNSAEQILNEMPCSVLAVKPDDFVGPVGTRAGTGVDA